MMADAHEGRSPKSIMHTGNAHHNKAVSWETAMEESSNGTRKDANNMLKDFAHHHEKSSIGDVPPELENMQRPLSRKFPSSQKDNISIDVHEEEEEEAQPDIKKISPKDEEKINAKMWRKGKKLLEKELAGVEAGSEEDESESDSELAEWSRLTLAVSPTHMKSKSVGFRGGPIVGSKDAHGNRTPITVSSSPSSPAPSAIVPAVVPMTPATEDGSHVPHFEFTPRALKKLENLRQFQLHEAAGQPSGSTPSHARAATAAPTPGTFFFDEDDDETEDGDTLSSKGGASSTVEGRRRSRRGSSLNSELPTPLVLKDLAAVVESRPDNMPTNRPRSLSPRSIADESISLVDEASETGSTPHHRHQSSVHKRHRSHFSQKIEAELISRLGAMHVGKVRATAVNKFNTSTKEGTKYLLEQEFIRENNAADLASFLSGEPGLSKRKLGEFFGNGSAFNQEVFQQFLSRLNFRGMTLDEALRSMVLRFRMPGEAQQIDRIMEQFAKSWHKDNDGAIFSCADTAYILAFSLMMLNTDMYNRSLKESEKMNVDQFCKNNSGIDQGQDLPREVLEGMYQRIRLHEIRMDEGDMFESSVITFVAPKLSGWLKKKSNGVFAGWKRHWFVLVDGVLYYFHAPLDEAPRCIIPLEHVTVEALGKTDISIMLRDMQGYVKSVKKFDDGRMETGSHRAFVLRAEKEEERNRWLSCLISEIPTQPSCPNSPDSDKTELSPASSRRMSVMESGQISQGVTVEFVSTPSIRGWARTKNLSSQQSHASHRYAALFPAVGGSKAGSAAIHFFGSSDMCDRMVNDKLLTSHGSLSMSSVTQVRLLNCFPGAPEGQCGFMVMAGVDKQWLIIPDAQDTHQEWKKLLREVCPQIGEPEMHLEPYNLNENSSKRLGTGHHGGASFSSTISSISTFSTLTPPPRPGSPSAHRPNSPSPSSGSVNVGTLRGSGSPDSASISRRMSAVDWLMGSRATPGG